MSDGKKYDVQFIIASGPGEPQRAVFAFSAALAAAHSGLKVVVALTMHGAHWACESQSHVALVPGFPPVPELIEMLHDAGVTIEACSACVDNYCPSPMGDNGQKMLGWGIERVGLSTIAMRMAETQTTLC